MGSFIKYWFYQRGTKAKQANFRRNIRFNPSRHSMGYLVGSPCLDTISRKTQKITKALNTTLSETIKIVDEETRNISKLALGWPSHLRILENLISGSKRFMDLVEAANQNNPALSKHLDILKRVGYVDKKLIAVDTKWSTLFSGNSRRSYLAQLNQKELTMPIRYAS
jgi:DNA-binding transcriptional ArsR family regulator